MGRFGISQNPAGVGLALLDGPSDKHSGAGARHATTTGRAGSSGAAEEKRLPRRHLLEVEDDDLEYSEDEEGGADREGSSESSDGSSTTDSDDHHHDAGGSGNGGEDDDDEEEEEPPHPLGFSGLRGAGCRYGIRLRRPRRPLGGGGGEAARGGRGGSPPAPSSSPLLRPGYRPPRQEFPPLSSYLDPRVASTRDLVDSVRSLALAPTAAADDDDEDYYEDDDDDDDLSGVDLAAEIRNGEIREIASLFLPADRTLALPPSSALARADPLRGLSADAQAGPYRGMQKDRQAVRAEVEHLRGPILREHEDRRKALTRLIRDQEEAARRIREEIDRHQRDADSQQERLQQQQQLEDERARAEEQRKEALEEERRRQKEEDAKAKDEAERQEREHITRAEKLMAQLVQVRASVEPFEASAAPGIKARRLQMKKLVGGKINTLTENAGKVRSVAAEVSRAIAAARDDDERAKQQIAAKAPGAAPEMARGKRYLLDLLSSKVVVRIQAEGFNGVRGDGFPLANMLALVANDNKDLGPVLAAHIYTVCPTAIPTLPTPSPNASEDELMESLGMQKKEDGTFESFERFLHRTEGIISLVAEIMASNPPTHTLFSGHGSAIKWLSRFLDLLPEAPASPLPLLTAPVLDAFLTGAGHMLANVHPDEFKVHLDAITSDILPRLDEGPVGAPSATRLKKTVRGGFESFRTDLPSKALPELYYGANEGAGHAKPSVPPTSSSGAAPPNPFGAAQPRVPNPFGPSAATSSQGASASSSAPNPFTAGTQTSFGASQGAVGGGTPAKPFGSSAPSNPFGGGGGGRPSASAPSPFSAAPSPFGTTAAKASGPFGSTSVSSPSPFASSVSTGTDAGMDAGDGAAASTAASFSRASGMGLTSSGPSSFVTGPSPFGGTPAPSQNPFSTSHPSPFGMTTAPAPAPFGSFTGAAAATSPSPFSTAGLQVPTASGISPFGSVASNPSPFATASAPLAQASMSSAFGKPAVSGTTPSTFGVSALTQSASTGFGLSASAPFQANPTSFGQVASASPFGQNPAASTFAPSAASSSFGQSTSTFGSSTPFGQASSTSFGQSSSSPFAASTPFGQASLGTTTPGPSAFGNAGSGLNQQQPSAFGSTKQIPCRFYARGTCSFGANCRFSHDAPPAQQSFNSPFGGPRR